MAVAFQLPPFESPFNPASVVTELESVDAFVRAEGDTVKGMWLGEPDDQFEKVVVGPESGKLPGGVITSVRRSILASSARGRRNY